jgi:hypothetical protein
MKIKTSQTARFPNRSKYSLALVGTLFMTITSPAMGAAVLQADGELGSWGSYEYVCPSDSSTLTPISVLAETGNHDVFLGLFEEYDPEGFAILSDPILADKTVWAPLDTAFESITGDLENLEAEQIKEVLGYHISPPRSDPSGAYPVLTPKFLADGGELKHRTRTGVLTGSDQRTLTRTKGEILVIEGIEILPTSWCVAAGSVFSINDVILDVEPPGFIEKTYNQLIRILFYDDIRFFIYSLGGSIVIGTGVSLVLGRIKKRRSQS